MTKKNKHKRLIIYAVALAIGCTLGLAKHYNDKKALDKYLNQPQTETQYVHTTREPVSTTTTRITTSLRKEPVTKNKSVVKKSVKRRVATTSKVVTTSQTSKKVITTKQSTTLQSVYSATLNFQGTWYEGGTTTYGYSGRTLVSGYSVASNYFPQGTIIKVEGCGLDGTYRVDDKGGMSNNVVDFFYHYGEVPSKFRQLGRVNIKVCEVK